MELLPVASCLKTLEVAEELRLDRCAIGFQWLGKELIRRNAAIRGSPITGQIA